MKKVSKVGSSKKPMKKYKPGGVTGPGPGDGKDTIPSSAKAAFEKIKSKGQSPYGRGKDLENKKYDKPRTMEFRYGRDNPKPITMMKMKMGGSVKKSSKKK